LIKNTKVKKRYLTIGIKASDRTMDTVVSQNDVHECVILLV